MNNNLIISIYFIIYIKISIYIIYIEIHILLLSLTFTFVNKKEALTMLLINNLLLKITIFAIVNHLISFNIIRYDDVRITLLKRDFHVNITKRIWFTIAL